MGLDGLHSIDPDPDHDPTPTPTGRGAVNYQIETLPPPTRAPAGPVKFAITRTISRKARRNKGTKGQSASDAAEHSLPMATRRQRPQAP